MRKTQVLFFDQNQSRFQEFKASLSESHYSFKLVTSFEECINLFENESDWNVLVLDASFLSEEKVYGWVKSLKTSLSFLKVILLGKDGSKSELLKSIRLGATEYLEAPVTEKDFHQTLTQLLDEFRFHQPVSEVLTDLQTPTDEKPHLRLLSSSLAPVTPTSTGITPSSAWSISCSPENANRETLTNSSLSQELSQSLTETVTLSFTVMKRRWAESFERQYLTELLVKMQGNVSAAAREAKLDRSNFLRLLRKHRLKAEVYRKSQSIAA